MQKSSVSFQQNISLLAGESNCRVAFAQGAAGGQASTEEQLNHSFPSCGSISLHCMLQLSSSDFHYNSWNSMKMNKSRSACSVPSPGCQISSTQTGVKQDESSKTSPTYQDVQELHLSALLMLMPPGAVRPEEKERLLYTTYNDHQSWVGETQLCRPAYTSQLFFPGIWKKKSLYLSGFIKGWWGDGLANLPKQLKRVLEYHSYISGVQCFCSSNTHLCHNSPLSWSAVPRTEQQPRDREKGKMRLVFPSPERDKVRDLPGNTVSCLLNTDRVSRHHRL